MALATSGLVGSDLANMINEAAINAVKANREYVCQQDLMEALEQVIAGKEKKDKILSKEERKVVSYHEVGHAITSAALDGAEPVQKITIVPRTKGSLGYVLPVPEDETFLHTREEIIDEITVLLAGRAAEEINLTANQVNLLRAVVDGVRKFTSSEMMERYRLNSSANVTRVKDALQKKEVITFDAEEGARFIDPLFEYWLRNYYFL